MILKLNRGYLHLETSRDTSAFACDSLEDWWLRFGRYQYPSATSLLLLCDGGGSNSSRSFLFKAHLQSLVNRIALPIRVAHYPPYTSKYKPIAASVIPARDVRLPGVIFQSMDLVKKLMKKPGRGTGLVVVVDILDRVYETGKK